MQRILSIAGLAIFALSSGTAAAQQARAEVGVVEKLRNQAVATYAGDERPLSLTAPVWFEDTLRTGADARLTSRFADDSRLTLGENAAVLIDRFVYDPGTGSRTIALRSAAGAFLLAVENLGDGARNSVEVRTPVAVIGIRGTTVWGGEIDDGYGVLALDGTVTVTTDARTTTLRPGEGVTIIAPSEPYAPVVWGPAKVARAVATVSYDDE